MNEEQKRLEQEMMISISYDDEIEELKEEMEFDKQMELYHAGIIGIADDLPKEYEIEDWEAEDEHMKRNYIQFLKNNPKYKDL